MLIHLSLKPLGQLYNVPQRKWCIKPTGLWLSYDDEWDEFNREGLGFNYKYRYEFILKNLYVGYDGKAHPGKILYLLPHQVDSFSQKYILKDDNIDWNRVKEDYAGIDFGVYSKLEASMEESLWYWTVDIKSVVIWDVSVVESYRQIEMREGGND